MNDFVHLLKKREAESIQISVVINELCKFVIIGAIFVFLKKTFYGEIW
jgi:hypothetical protein